MHRRMEPDAIGRVVRKDAAALGLSGLIALAIAFAPLTAGAQSSTSGQSLQGTVSPIIGAPAPATSSRPASPQPSSPTPAPASPAAQPGDAELLFWQSIKDSTDAADFREYIAQYPRGRFTGLARNRIAALERPATPAPGVAATGSAVPAGRRVALVIGNGAYVHVSPLDNTLRDARLIAGTLKKLGFELIGDAAQIDLDRPHFVDAIARFGDRLAGSDVALFYYAGHGVRVRNENYLVPVDANPTKPSDADIQLITAQLVLDQMEDSGAKLKFVLLDACRNNPFGGRGLRDAAGGLAEMRAPEGTLISYATQPGNVARDGEPGGDSPYTIALSRAMQESGVEMLRMFNEVGVIVDNATQHEQQPWVEHSPISGEFYFAGH